MHHCRLHPRPGGPRWRARHERRGEGSWLTVAPLTRADDTPAHPPRQAWLTSTQAVEYLRNLGPLSKRATEEEQADLVHAIYARITVTRDGFVEAELTPAAYAHGLALAMPKTVTVWCIGAPGRSRGRWCSQSGADPYREAPTVAQAGEVGMSTDIPDRELVTLLMYLETGSYKAAAFRLGISESTARQRVSSLIRRIGATNAAQASWRLRADLEPLRVPDRSHGSTDSQQPTPLQASPCSMPRAWTYI